MSNPTTSYDLERKKIVIEIDYNPSADYDRSGGGKTDVILSNAKLSVALDTGLIVDEGFFITIGVYRYDELPKSLR